MRWIFWGFCRNWFLIDPLHYLSSHSDFGFVFAGLGESGSRQLSDSASRGVDNSPNRRVGESAFECLKENSASQRVGNSPTWQVGESFFDYEYLREFEAKIGMAQNVLKGTYAEPISAKTPENPPHCHVP
jgi:hypothetical protein